MTSTQLIAIVAVVVPCGTALLVGYWHRQQMRQVELFRLDPSVGVVPPPSRPVAFFKRHRDLIIGVVLPLLSLAPLILPLIVANRPLPSTSAAILMFNVGSVLFNLQTRSELRVVNLLLEVVTVVKVVTEVQRKQTETMATRLAQVEELVKESSS